jgi:site-specific DNA-methyltransferase (adenine-specific)
MVGDCRESMATLEAESVDAVVCDPPYHLTSIVDRFGSANAAPVKVPEGGSGVYARSTKGFMGQQWDGGDVAFRHETWREVWRVLKPGGHLLAFSGSRTYHRMACAIEDAGFDVRDQIMWLYGSGFPKSHDVSKAIDKAAGAEREVTGKVTSVTGRRIAPSSAVKRDTGMGREEAQTNFETMPATDDARRWSGWGTALKPAHEPICMARKPPVGTVAANVLRYGTGAINVDGCRIDGDDKPLRWEHGRGMGYHGAEDKGRCAALEQTMGRWPANVIHDGSDEATEGLRDAARYFYTAKASGEDRDEMIGDVPKNVHPTVKPTDLMRYLVRMVTPPGGLVLDPFTGSGSTGRAAMLEGMRFVGCELSPEYAEIARARIRFTLGPLFAHEVI